MIGIVIIGLVDSHDTFCNHRDIRKMEFFNQDDAGSSGTFTAPDYVAQGRRGDYF